MGRDGRMAKLVETEPITPFLHRVCPLFTELGVSTILVAGSCGDFFDVADVVVKMQEYRCQDVTKEAKQIAREMPSSASVAGNLSSLPAMSGKRLLDTRSLQPGGKVKADRDRGIIFGDTEIDLTCVEQLVDSSQTRFIMDCLVYLGSKGGGEAKVSMSDLLIRLTRELESPSLACPLDLVSPWAGPNGAYTRPRRQELAAAINRLRTLAVTNSR